MYIHYQYKRSIVLMYSNIPIDRNLKAAFQHRPLPCAGPCDHLIAFCLRSKVIGGVLELLSAGVKTHDDPRYVGRRGFL